MPLPMSGRKIDNSLGMRRVDAELNCIKGGGACHLREKVLAEAAETYVNDCTSILRRLSASESASASASASACSECGY